MRDLTGQGKHFRAVSGDDPGISRVGCRRPGGAVHPVQVVTHRGQRAAEFLTGAGRLLGVADPQAKHEPTGIGLGQEGRRAVCGLRLAGPDVGDGGAEHHPLSCGQQHGDLDQGVLADDLVGPHGAVPGVFQPGNGFTLQDGVRGGGQ